MQAYLGLIDTALEDLVSYASEDMDAYLGACDIKQYLVLAAVVVLIALLYGLVFARDVAGLKERQEVYRRLLLLVPLECIISNPEFQREYDEAGRLVST